VAKELFNTPGTKTLIKPIQNSAVEIGHG